MKNGIIDGLTEARQMGDDLLNEGCRYLNDTEV